MPEFQRQTLSKIAGICILVLLAAQSQALSHVHDTFTDAFCAACSASFEDAADPALETQPEVCTFDRPVLELPQAPTAIAVYRPHQPRAPPVI